MLNDKNCIRYIKKGQQEGLEYVIRTYGGAVKSVFSKIIEKQNKGIIEEKYIDDDFLDNKYTGDNQVLGMNEEDLPMDGGDIAVYDSVSYEYTNGKYRVKKLNDKHACTIGFGAGGSFGDRWRAIRNAVYRLMI